MLSLMMMMSLRSRDDQIPTDFDDIPGDQIEQGEDEEGITDGLQIFVLSTYVFKLSDAQNLTHCYSISIVSTFFLP